MFCMQIQYQLQLLRAVLRLGGNAHIRRKGLSVKQSERKNFGRRKGVNNVLYNSQILFLLRRLQSVCGIFFRKIGERARLGGGEKLSELLLPEVRSGPQKHGAKWCTTSKTINKW